MADFTGQILSSSYPMRRRRSKPLALGQRSHALHVVVSALLVSAVLFLFIAGRWWYTPDGARHVVASQPEHHAPSVAGAPSSVPELATLSSMCASTDWKPGLWIQCHSNCGKEGKNGVCGGLTNARNRITACLRWGIEIGAGVILPKVLSRDERLFAHAGPSYCPDAWFDIPAFKQAMDAHCPQMPLAMCTKPASLQPREGRTVEPEWKDTQAPGYANRGDRSFRELVKKTLERANIDPASISEADPVVLPHGDPLLGWNYAASGEMGAMRQDLFRVFNYNRSVRQLGLDMVNSKELKGGAYFGVHLRGEKDWPANRATGDEQMVHYFHHILETARKMPEAKEMKTVYVSCGDRAVVDKFRELLTPRGYTVYDKWSFEEAYPAQYAEVDRLDFDAKGIVEYEVMLNSRFFVGNSMSSLSLLVTYARTLNDEKDFFEEYVNPDSERWDMHREYRYRVVKGNGHTSLFLVSGPDIMEYFP